MAISKFVSTAKWVPLIPDFLLPYRNVHWVKIHVVSVCKIKRRYFPNLKTFLLDMVKISLIKINKSNLAICKKQKRKQILLPKWLLYALKVIQIC